jgi:[protein-PII] uridylyltransferase
VPGAGPKRLEPRQIIDLPPEPAVGALDPGAVPGLRYNESRWDQRDQSHSSSRSPAPPALARRPSTDMRSELASSDHRAAVLESTTLAQELKSYLANHRASLEAKVRLGSDESGLPAAERLAKTYDGLFCSLFKAVECALTKKGKWTNNVALAAVGSYGRGALALHSDLDVRLVTGGRAEKVRHIAEAVLYPLWDAGLSVGHQVVTPADQLELARTDLPTATTLLDFRLLAGDGATTDKMLERAYDGIFQISNIGKFLERLSSRAEERQARFGDSVYLLEPDVKNGSGGLRDLDLMHWAARARWRANQIEDLVRLSVLLPREWQQIDAASRFAWRVRNLLHLHAGRRSDRLSFDQQELIAGELGYGNSGPGVESFMSEYYRHARSLSQCRDMLLQRAEPPPKRRPRETPIGNGLKLTNEQVSIENPSALETDPTLALRVYEEAIRRDLPVYPFARDSIARAASVPEVCDRLRNSDEAQRTFARLVTTVQRTRLRAGSVLRELHDVGLLVALVPEFAPVVGRVHHDVYHVYTVDVHSVACVDRLRELCRGDLATEHPLASHLAAEISRANVLFFAALLHDIGKDIGGRDHAKRGHDMAATILGRLGIAESDIREVQHLVNKHLLMYHVATRRDLDDPKTIESFCQEVHGREGLRELYVLTLCDVSTTSPTALTSWKARMLEELYLAADRFLEGGTDRGSARLDGVRRSVLEACPARGEQEFLEHYLKAMPERYLYANEVTHIVRHSRFARKAQTQQVNVTVMTTDAPYVELAFIADDKPGLLAMITATLAAARFKVISAQVYSWIDSFGRRRALDLFWVRGSTVEAVTSAIPRLERDFGRLMSQELTPAALVTDGGRTAHWSDRPTPGVQTEVVVDNRCATRDTVIEVTTRDQLGLLFWLSNALQSLGLQISLAKINTEGTQVADVFYVTDADGAKVSDPERIEAIKARILSTVSGLEKRGAES